MRWLGLYRSLSAGEHPERFWSPPRFRRIRTSYGPGYNARCRVREALHRGRGRHCATRAFSGQHAALWPSRLETLREIREECTVYLDEARGF